MTNKELYQYYKDYYKRFLDVMAMTKKEYNIIVKKQYLRMKDSPILKNYIILPNGEASLITFPSQLLKGAIEIREGTIEIIPDEPIENRWEILDIRRE